MRTTARPCPRGTTADDEYDEVPVVLDDPVGKGHLGPYEIEAVYDAPSETPSYGKERAVSRQGPREGIEHDHENVHVSQPGKDAAEKNRRLSFKEGTDEYAYVTVFCDIRFHAVKRSAPANGPLRGLLPAGAPCPPCGPSFYIDVMQWSTQHFACLSAKRPGSHPDAGAQESLAFCFSTIFTRIMPIS